MHTINAKTITENCVRLAVLPTVAVTTYETGTKVNDILIEVLFSQWDLIEPLMQGLSLYVVAALVSLLGFVSSAVSVLAAGVLMKSSLQLKNGGTEDSDSAGAVGCACGKASVSLAVKE